MITGAGGDIGRAVALLLAERGWSLALVEHPAATDALESTCAECVRVGADAWTGTFDVTDAVAVAASVAAMVAAIGPPAALFNNAGYQGAFAPIDRYPLDDARRVIEVNVIGVLNVLSVVGAAMSAVPPTSGGSTRGGAIVNTASMAGVSGAPNMPAYSASKAAVVGLTKSAAKDLAPAGIRVNAVSPAFIGPGRMWDRQVELQASVGSQYYATEPAEVARVVAFLLSDEASYLTGVNIEIAGGSA